MRIRSAERTIRWRWREYGKRGEKVYRDEAERPEGVRNRESHVEA
jgi:hypothetical protein